MPADPMHIYLPVSITPRIDNRMNFFRADKPVGFVALPFSLTPLRVLTITVPSLVRKQTK